MKNMQAHIKVHTPQLIKEILSNNETAALRAPLLQLRAILAEVASRAAEINDLKMNALMMRLTLYEVSDPYSLEYDSKLVSKTIEEAYE